MGKTYTVLTWGLALLLLNSVTADASTHSQYDAGLQPVNFSIQFNLGRDTNRRHYRKQHRYNSNGYGHDWRDSYYYDRHQRRHGHDWSRNKHRYKRRGNQHRKHRWFGHRW